MILSRLVEIENDLNQADKSPNTSETSKQESVYTKMYFKISEPSDFRCAKVLKLKNLAQNFLEVEKMVNLLWMHGGACNGNTQSFLNAEEPTIIDLVTDFGINILYHHSLSMEFGEQVRRLYEQILNDEIPLDILVVEGTIIQGPDGTGHYDMLMDRPKKTGFGISPIKRNTLSQSVIVRAGVEFRRQNRIRLNRLVFNI